jgi:hypothetical protein
MDRNQPAVEVLLAHKADVNAINNGANANGWTPLHWAAGPGYKAIAELLLKGGADVNARDKNGETPLYVAVYSGPVDVNSEPQRTAQRELVELLLAHQADANAAGSGGWAPLHKAAANANKPIAEILLKASADVNARGNGGFTPLHIAVQNGKWELAELLLANKADPNARNNAGQTPLDVVNDPSTGGLTASMRDTLADLLRKHGASDDLPRMDRIELRRPSTKYSSSVFGKGTNDWNQFTLLDLIGVQYGFLASSPNAGGGGGYSPSEFVNAAFNKSSSLGFPDLAHLRIRRPAADLKSWQEQVVDFRPVLESGDCSQDVRLEWGDVVDIPEADHRLNEQWRGFSKTNLANLKKCLTRRIEIVINGQTTNITLAPRITNVGGGEKAANATSTPGMSFEARLPAMQGVTIYANTPFWLKPVLGQSWLVLTSSDLRHVKVTRRDPATGQTREWVVDCSEASPAPDFWLSDGDKIEVPEKTN